MRREVPGGGTPLRDGLAIMPKLKLDIQPSASLLVCKRARCLRWLESPVCHIHDALPQTRNILRRGTIYCQQHPVSSPPFPAPIADSFPSRVPFTDDYFGCSPPSRSTSLNDASTRLNYTPLSFDNSRLIPLIAPLVFALLGAFSGTAMTSCAVAQKVNAPGTSRKLVAMSSAQIAIFYYISNGCYSLPSLGEKCSGRHNA